MTIFLRPFILFGWFPSSNESKSLLSSTKSRIYISIFFLVALFVFIFLFNLLNSPSYEYTRQPIIRDDLIVNINATGNIRPLNQVDVGVEVSGLIEEVLVDFNDIVKEGTVLAILDTDQLEARVKQSEAELASSKARVKEAQANKTEANNNLQRALTLFNKENFSEKSLDNAKSSFSRAEAALEIAQSQVTISEANLYANQTNLSKAKITAPINGIVLERLVETGQTVASSFQTPILFKLAEDLTVMELSVDIDEADIGQISIGQKAIFTVDAYPGKIFPSSLKSVRFSPKEENGVITYEALLEVTNSDLLLRPGMTARATITTAEKKDIFMVPYSALRFSPPLEFTNDESETKRQSNTKAPGFIGMLMPRFSRNNNNETISIKTGETLSIWTLKDNEPYKIPVKVGLLNGQFAEISSNELSLNLEIILGMKVIK